MEHPDSVAAKGAPELPSEVENQSTPHSSIFDDATFQTTEVPVPDSSRATRLTNRAGEAIFAAVGPAAHANGWCVIPQERDDRRRPSIVDGRTLQWGRYINERPSAEDVDRWSMQAYGANAALILGAVSGNVFALDIDVTDLDLALTIDEIADRILGRSPLHRIGRAPKRAIFYRMQEASDLPRKDTYRIANRDGSDSGHAIEILGTGGLITIYGNHHVTGGYFKWRDGQPATNRPEDAPLVTKSMLEEFIAAVQREVGDFYRAPVSASADFETVEVNGIQLPKMDGVGTTWTVVDGLVTDGREEYLFQLCRTITKHNGHFVGQFGGLDALKSAVFAEFKRNTAPSLAWPEMRIKREIASKIERAAQAVRDGRLKPRLARQVRTESGETKALLPIKPMPLKPVEHPFDTFDWLTPRRTVVAVTCEGPDEDRARERRMRTDLEEAGRETTAAVVEGIDAWIDDVVLGEGRIHVIPGATGAGKSTQTLIRIAAQLDRIKSSKPEEGEEKGPLVFVVPQYRNISELRDKAWMLSLDADASDDELIDAAEARGIAASGDVDDYIAGIRRFAAGSGLRTMVYEGKVKAGCQRADEMRLLNDAGVGSSALCKSRVAVRDSQGRKTGQHEDKYCPFYSTCKAIQQRSLIKESDVVFVVRNFLALTVPEELKDPRGVVIDERYFDLLVHTARFPLSTLELPRKVTLTKKEREAGMVEEDLLASRDTAADLAIAALKAGRDVAASLVEWKDNALTGADIVRDARRICGGAMSSQAAIHPDMTLEQIAEICAKPQGKDVGKEYRFWKLVEERIDDLLEARLNSMKKVHDKDIRIALLQPESDSPEIRIAWRTEPNWTAASTLILDASVDEKITSKVLGRREVVTHHVPAHLNMHVLAAVDQRLSMRSLFPGRGAEEREKSKAARLLHEVRTLISTLCGVHSNGRVLIALPKKLRKAVLLSWYPPMNADFAHDGAVAGLDFAKDHVAVVALSRTELPTSEVDGIVAALTHDDEHPEAPIDPLGTGQDEDGHTIYPAISRRVIKRRDGSDLSWDIQEHAGEWARRVQRQYREEEFSQKIGRGRPIFRPEPLAVYAITQSLPEDLLVDEVCGFIDIATKSGAPLWDSMRLAGGIADPKLMALYGSHYGDAANFTDWIADHIESIAVTRSKFHRLRIEDRDGRRDVYIAGTCGDPAAYWQQYADYAQLGGAVVEVEECTCVRHSQEAPIDAVAEDLGDPLAQSMAELKLINDGKRELIKRGEWRPEGSVMLPPDVAKRRGKAACMVPLLGYRLGEGELEMERMPLGAWIAMKNVVDGWVLGIEEDGSESEPAAAVA